eukprot:SAG11_NODE_27920_length_327_cov_0.899123_1_plen_23_part_01
MLLPHALALIGNAAAGASVAPPP